MTFVNNGLLNNFLDLIGVQINSPDAQYIAFIVLACVFGAITISFLVLIFKFLCYLRG